MKPESVNPESVNLELVNPESVNLELANLEFQTGDRVSLIASPPYLKTAEPIPMLRPADKVAVGSQGVILGRAPGNVWRVRFENGAYLLELSYLAPVMPADMSVKDAALPQAPRAK
ncbi:MAG: DUF3148 domain-containing protein [Thermosynechococcaceae cyanobacterium MS004]|nr:DUF3148 domain-containing protein [Thermosynechococcaceae cyanobacterium MS004]